ncbi:hypothetical protein HHK36_018135 [Tetracentron sinense]|uniref:HAT C-terminal dimerisation domain-containing protein n=1 Tax=Tetracentron sinense TaxID=13715 RepID=A0A835DD85_TETSI|nr:hypothetical protein HHK36_018135 [Tetracentron sinense]
MDDKFVAPGRSRHNAEDITNLHRYRAEFFYTTIDMQLQELNDRFNEANTELLLCMACLDPSDSFCTFDKQKLIRLAEFYPVEFSAIDLMALDNQLQTYIMDMRSNSEFSDVKGISGLAEKMVKTRKNILYPLIYLLVTLALILSVATATVERAFSAMKIIKNRLRNRMGDEWMNDCLVVYIEKDIFDSIENEAIIQRFQNMKTRRAGTLGAIGLLHRSTTRSVTGASKGLARAGLKVDPEVFVGAGLHAAATTVEVSKEA